MASAMKLVVPRRSSKCALSLGSCGMTFSMSQVVAQAGLAARSSGSNLRRKSTNSSKSLPEAPARPGAAWPLIRL
eukprot:3746495-Heterocapsa_arctica.AAC.1